MKHISWSHDEAEEYEALLAAVVGSATATADRVDEMERLVTDATQAHRPWARDVDREAQRTGYASQIKAFLKRNRVLFSYNGDQLSKPRVIGVRRRAEDTGQSIDVQELIEAVTFDELREKRAAYLTQLKAYDSSIALLDRLLALADAAPAARSPRDAAAQLGIDLDDFLSKPLAA